MELIITTSDGRQLSLVAYRSWDDEFYTELQYHDLVLRKLHTHDGHKNPINRHEVDGCHMHFPSHNYPLHARGRSSYAYPLADYDLRAVEECVQLFCTELGIMVDAIQPYLND